ncbi:CotS family spore coat protein [Lachnotalea sp. AF33-28]|nr:CotS family spore coat protein [Lachnotalea sp. AF33-28]
MNERGTLCLTQYDLRVAATRRGRGAVICETDKGLKLLKECTAGENRIMFEDKVLSGLELRGNLYVDKYVRSIDQKLVTEDSDGTRYVLKDWFDGKECDVKNPSEIILGVKELAVLHKALRGINMADICPADFCMPISLRREYEKHNTELRRARMFIRNTKNKSQFELMVLQSFDSSYRQAEEALCLLRCMDSMPEPMLCHGDYTHHHILVGARYVAVTDFSRMHLGVQIWDLYHFMRKIMEKHDWDLGLGKSMLEAYQRILPITEQEYEYLYVLFLYPEKYWKQINYYFNANKAWIPGRNVEKLQKLEIQAKERQKFLDWMREHTGFAGKTGS